MKLIFLNAYSGKLREPMEDFLSEQSISTDIFCLAEADGAMPAILGEELGGYRRFTAGKYIDEEETFSQAVCAKKSVEILDSGAILEEKDNMGLAFYAHIKFRDKDLYVCAVHGISRPGNKLDNPGRLAQSRGIIEFFQDKPGEKIIGGDFNLLPETESVKMFGKAGYVDLIEKFGIETTRNRFAWNRFPAEDKQMYADYAFVTPGIEVKGFSVPAVDVADHLPLILEI